MNATAISHPACALCRGACCETLIMPLMDLDTHTGRAWNELILTRGERIELTDHTPAVELRLKCRHLGPQGQCLIWDRRPLACRQFQPGGQHCLLAIKRQRTFTEPIIKALHENHD